MKKISILLVCFLISCTGIQNTISNDVKKNPVSNPVTSESNKNASEVATSNTDSFLKDFRIGNSRKSLQTNPSIAIGEKGGVITWITYQNNGFDVYAQLLDTNNNPVGKEFKVNSNKIVLTDAYSKDLGIISSYPKVVMDKNGNFVISFYSEFDIKSNLQPNVELSQKAMQKVYLRRYDSNGNPIGEEFSPKFKVNDFDDYVYSGDNFFLNENGEILLISGKYIQYFDKNNKAIGNSIVCNEGNDISYAVRDEIGNLLVLFEKYNPESGIADLYGQRYSKIGEKINTSFKIKNYSVGYKKTMGLSMDKNGNFIVVGARSNPINEKGLFTFNLYAQKYSIDNKEVGTEIKVGFSDVEPNIRTFLKDNGEFVVTWGQELIRDQKNDVFVRRFDKNGVAKEDTFKANFLSNGNTAKPDISFFNDNFVVTWCNWNDNQEDFSIYARKYNLSNKIEVDDITTIPKEKTDCTVSLEKTKKLSKYDGNLNIKVIIDGKSIDINNQTKLSEIIKQYTNASTNYDTFINFKLNSNPISFTNITASPEKTACLEMIKENIGLVYKNYSFRFYLVTPDYNKLNFDSLEDLLRKYIKNEPNLYKIGDGGYGIFDTTTTNQTLEFASLSSLINFWLFLHLKVNYGDLFEYLYLSSPVTTS